MVAKCLFNLLAVTVLRIVVPSSLLSGIFLLSLLYGINFFTLSQNLLALLPHCDYVAAHAYLSCWVNVLSTFKVIQEWDSN